jgi:hypothetical protein
VPKIDNRNLVFESKAYVDIKVAYSPLRPLFETAVVRQGIVLFEKDCIVGHLRPREEGYRSRAVSTIEAYERLCGKGRLVNENGNARGYLEFKRFPVFKRNACVPVAQELNRLVDNGSIPTWRYLEKMKEYHSTMRAVDLRIEGSARMNRSQVNQINAALGLERDV